jgi:hypothetical protein
MFAGIAMDPKARVAALRLPPVRKRVPDQGLFTQ